MEARYYSNEAILRTSNTIIDGIKYCKRYYGLECDLLTRTNILDYEEWLEARKLGITGTDVGGILRISKYSTPMKVYLDKIGELEPVQDNEKMYWGRVMEPIVAKEFQIRNKVKIQKVNAILKHPFEHWALGNIDRLVTNEKGEKGILEIKTVDRYLESLWTGEEVPPQYMVQLQWYMYVTGVKYGYFSALIGGNNYIQKYVARDDELIEMLVSSAREFWIDNVMNKKPPFIDGSNASTKLLMSLYPESKETSQVILPDEVNDWINKIGELKLQSNEISEQISEYENKIKEILKNSETGIIGDRKVSWKSQIRKTIDSKRLKEEQPQIYEKYIKTTSFRKFDIK